MFEKIVSWVLEKLGRERFEIGRHGDVYLTRWTLLGKRYAGNWRVFLHLFHRSDYAGAFHDHPWGFWSLILWPGYWEHMEAGRKWYGPLSLLKRPAAWRHRVEIPDGRKVWTLVWTGKKEQSWGFFCPGGFRPWREHVAKELTGVDGCSD